MKGLILKDIYIATHQLKSLLLSLVIIGVVLLAPLFTDGTTEGHFGFIAMCAVLFSTFTTSTFAYDEKTDWMKYALATSVSRKQYLLAKYTVHMLFGTGGVLLGTAVAAALTVIAGEMTAENLVLMSVTALVSLGLVVYIGVMQIPLLVKFGAERGRVFLMLGFIPIGLLFTGIVLLPENPELALSYHAVIGILAALLLALFIVMLCLGGRWMAKKEF